MTISKETKPFFLQLGARIAELRKGTAITRVQLAAILDVSRRTVNSYEVGRLRAPPLAPRALAWALAVSIDEVVGEPQSTARKLGPSPKMQQQLERITQLPKAQPRVVVQMLNGVLQKTGS